MVSFLALLFSATISHAEVQSVTVGRVGDHILTSREVHMQTLMEKSLFGGGKEALRVDPLDSKSFFASVNDSILEYALATEAKNFDVAHFDDKELKELEARLSKTLFNSEAWKKLEAQPSEWRAGLERKLKAKQFVKFRKESSELPVTDSEAKRYFEENRAKFSNLPFENFRDNIKTFLARSQVDRRLKDWYEVIKAKYSAKNFLSEL